MTSNPHLQRLARNIKRGGDSTAHVPRVTSTQMYLGTVGSVDPFNGVLDFEFNDPSGLVLPGVRYLQAYSSLNLPAQGHSVWVQHFGTDIMVLGQQVNPTNIVIP